MAKSRKDLFEEQLRDLQKDISTLNQKLSTTATNDSGSSKMTTLLSGKESQKLSDMSIESVAHPSIRVAISSPLIKINTSTDEKAMTVDSLRHDLHVANRDRDDALYRLEQAKTEIEQLRKGLQEYSRLKASYEHLKQDSDSVRISLESSERIRKQQKELIALLQRSHAMSSSASHAADNSSVMSAAGDSYMSSIAPSDEMHTSGRIFDQSHSFRDRTHSLGSATADSFPSFLAGDLNHPTDITSSSADLTSTANSKQQSKMRRRKSNRPSVVQSPAATTSTKSAHSTSLSHVHRSTSAPLPIASSSRSVKSGKSRPPPQTQTQTHPQFAPPPNIQHNGDAHFQNYNMSQEQLHHQYQQQALFNQSLIGSLSYQAILQQSPSLVPPTMLSSAHSSTNRNSTLQNNSDYYTHNSSSALSNNSFASSTSAREGGLLSNSANNDAHRHFAPHYYQQPAPVSAQSTLTTGSDMGRPPRHPPSSSTAAPISSSSASSAPSSRKPSLDSTQRVRNQPPAGSVAPSARVDSWSQPTGSPYALPSYSAYGRSASPTKSSAPATMQSRSAAGSNGNNRRLLTTVRTKKTRSSVSTPTSTSSARLIHVPVPSPATTFGASQRRF